MLRDLLDRLLGEVLGRLPEGPPLYPEEMLTDRTRLVAVTMISNALGTINPVKEIIAKAHAAGVPVLERAYEKWLGETDLAVMYRLFAAQGGMADAEAGLAMWSLAELAHAAGVELGEGDEQREPPARVGAAPADQPGGEAADEGHEDEQRQRHSSTTMVSAITAPSPIPKA